MAIQEVKMKFSSRTEAGVKGVNQDSLAIPPEKVDHSNFGFCLAVADGITMCPKGGELSEFASSIVERYYTLAREYGAGEDALNMALERLWEDFFLRVEKDHDEDFLLSGTTLTIALILNEKIHVRHLGDSHCDIFTPDGSSLRLTDEHNTPDGCLINYFGGEMQTAAQEETYDFPPGSKVILSSDGISYFLEPETMRNVGEKLNWHPEELIQELFALSLQAGTVDDLTVVYGF
jgi:serine/threonine protein phosphatase PrpC